MQSDFEVNIKNENGLTALELAAKQGWYTGCKLLLKSSSVRLDQTMHNKTLLHHLALSVPKTSSAVNKLGDVLDLALERGLDLNHQNENGNTALHKAISIMNYQAAAVLIKRGAKINIPNLSQQTALHLAVFLVNEDIADLLLKSGRFFAVQLTCVLSKYSSNVVGLMYGIWKELPDALKDEIAFRASACGHVPMLRFINDQGFDMNIKHKKDAKNLLQVAADEGQYDVCLYLLLHSTFTVPHTEFVNDTLFRIVRHAPTGTLEQGKLSTLLKLLIKSGNILIANSRGETVLHEAAFHGNLHVTEFLLQAGARVDVKNNTGDTPLHYAMRSKNLSVDLLKTLLDSVQGRSQLFSALNIRGLEGTVFDMADRCQNVEIIDFLKKLSVSN